MEALVLSVLATESWLETRGWDAPPTVLALLDDTIDGEGSCELTYSRIEGEPYEILEDNDWTDAAALVVAVEGWAWPADLPEDEQIGRPSEHPNRIEVRTVIAVSRSGEVISVLRLRGEDPFVEIECGGPLVAAIAAALLSSGDLSSGSRQRQHITFECSCSDGHHWEAPALYDATLQFASFVEDLGNFCPACGLPDHEDDELPHPDRLDALELAEVQAKYDMVMDGDCCLTWVHRTIAHPPWEPTDEPV